MRLKRTASVLLILSMLMNTAAIPTSAAAYETGDVNMDGSVNILDVIMINRAVLGKEVLSDEARVLGDVDRDGSCDSTDSLAILKYLVGIIPDFSDPNDHIRDGGDTLTIVSWNDNDLKNMIQVFNEDHPDINVEYLNCGGNSGMAAETLYWQFLNSGEDIDLYIAEVGWILKYINDDDYSVPLSELGITEDEFDGAYEYTLEVGRDSSGILKGASWQAAPGGYCYNADLAEQYLGITSPEEMQDRISDWDSFYDLSEELSQATNGEVTITASLDDMWQCYFTSLKSPWIVDGKLNTEPAREFTERIMKYVYNKSIDLNVSQWGKYDWLVLGKEGGTLGYFFSTWCLTEGNQLAECCGTDGNWRLIKGPQEYFWGGSWLCLSPHCDNKSDAATFIRYFTTEEKSMKKYAEYSGDFVNNRAVMEDLAESEYSNPLLGGQNQFAILKDVAEEIDLSNLTPYNETLKSCLKMSLHSLPMYEALHDPNVSVDAVIQDFELSVRAKLPELFPEE